MSDFFSQVWLAVFRRPLTYFLAVVSLGTGVAAFLCIGSLGETLLQSQTLRSQRAARIHGRPYVQATIGRAERRPLEPLERVRLVKQEMRREVAFGIEGGTRNVKFGRYVTPGHPLACSANWFSPAYHRRDAWIKGRLITAADDRSGAAVCVLDDETAGLLFGAADPVGKTIRVDGWPFRIVGVTDLLTPDLSRGYTMAVPLSTALTRFHDLASNQVNIIVLSDMTHITQDALRMEALVKTAFSGSGMTESPWLKWQTALKTLALIRLLIGGLACLLLTAGLLGTVSMLLANLGSRIHEIGVHRALGATRARQAALVLCEAAVTGLSAGLVGAILGIAILRLLSTAFHIELLTTPVWIAAAVFTSTFGALLAGLIPARAAMRVSPAESLRAE